VWYALSAIALVLVSVSGCSKHPDPTGVYKLSLASEEVAYDLRSDGQAVYASQFTLPDGAAGRTDGVGTWRFSNGSLIVETDRMCMKVSTDGKRGEASAREASSTDCTPLSSSVSSSSAAKTVAMLTRLTPLSSKFDRLDPDDLTRKVPSPRSTLVFPSPKIANRRSARPISWESARSFGR